MEQTFIVTVDNSEANQPSSLDVHEVADQLREWPGFHGPPVRLDVQEIKPVAANAFLRTRKDAVLDAC